MKTTRIILFSIFLGIFGTATNSYGDTVVQDLIPYGTLISYNFSIFWYPAYGVVSSRSFTTTPGIDVVFNSCPVGVQSTACGYRFVPTAPLADGTYQVSVSITGAQNNGLSIDTTVIYPFYVGAKPTTPDPTPTPTPSPTPTPPEDSKPDLKISNLSVNPVSIDNDGVPTVEKNVQLTATFDIRGENIKVSDSRDALITFQYGAKTLTSTLHLSEITTTGVIHKTFYFHITEDDLNPISRSLDSMNLVASINSDKSIDETDYSNNSISKLVRISGYQLKIQALDKNEFPLVDSSGNNIEITVPIQNLTVVPISLGGLVKFSLLDETGKPVSGTYQYNGSPNLDSTSIPLDTKNGLFFDQIGLLFNAGQTTANQNLFIVHLGTQNLIITPSDNSRSPITIVLKGIKPNSIGKGIYDCSYHQDDGPTLDNQYSNCDTLIIDKANSLGIPVQWLKSEIAQESGGSFNAKAYRYEPNFEKKYIGMKLDSTFNIEQPEANTALQKYFLYSNRNTEISRALLGLRSIYSIEKDQSKKIPIDYETTQRGYSYYPLSTWKLIDADFNLHKNAKGRPDPQNWFLEQTTKMAADKSYKWSPLANDYNKIAQTVVSSSYGIMQTMYSTAVNQMKYKDSTGKGLDPMGLFRPSTSINLGASLLATLYGSIYTKNPPSSFLDWKEKLRQTSARYNGGVNFQDPRPQKYSNEVMTKLTEYWIMTIN